MLNKLTGNERATNTQVFSWKDDFELNLLIFSIYSVLFGIGSFFLKEEYGLFFVYTCVSLGGVFFLTNFTAMVVGSRLDAKLDKDKNMSLDVLIKKEEKSKLLLYTLFSVGFTGLVWSLSWLDKFNIFTIYTFLPTVFSYLVLVCSVWCIFSSLSNWLKDKEIIRNKK